jgi:uncharacterized protein
VVKKLALLISLSVLLLGVWAFSLEPASLKNENYEIVLPSWPAACDGIRVAVLADLHVGSPYNGVDKLARIVDLTDAAKPDLILLAGDFVVGSVLGGSFVEPEIIAKGLSRLSAPLGVFAVLGNHDHWRNAKRVENALKAARIQVLEDTAVIVASGQCKFWLAGLSDFLEGLHAYQTLFANLPRGAPVLALTHNPDVFPLVPAAVSLTFAGHTHGGQVYLPILGRLIVPSIYGQRYAIGHIVEQGRHLFVSPGLGTSILPVRFLMPPEVSVVTIRSAVPRQHDHRKTI